MKKIYEEPEFELVHFRFDTALMNELTQHSITEQNGTVGSLTDDDGDDFEFP